ncbi:putative transcription factor C2H2 family [Helianthus debilis subsp. tardiflorus]
MADPYLSVDDLYFSALHDNEEIFPISDEKYAEELQLQEALISSSSSLPSPNQNASTVSCSSSASASAAASSSKQPLMSPSKSLYSFCGICMDTKTASEMFENTSSVCGHMYCSDCIRGHVAAKIKENVTAVKCPDLNCAGVIGPEACRSIVPKEVLERWENILCESVIMESDKFYCPFKDCSAMLLDDGGVTVTQSECPNCNRLFCAQCKVPWHCGMGCIEYQSFKKGERSPDDILLLDLAKNKKWMKCSNCNYFVEKTEGCQHISCRCGHHFCYGCGQPYDQGSHVCA